MAGPRKAPDQPDWSLGLVLDSLRSPPYEPQRLASLEDWGKKTLFLVALASGRRVSEIQALSFAGGACAITNERALLRTNPLFRAKNASSWQDHAIITIPALKQSDKPSAAGHTLCPVRALFYYRRQTAEVRGKQGAMFICFKKGKNTTAAKTSTLSGWFKSTVLAAYTENFSESVHGLRSIRFTS